MFSDKTPLKQRVLLENKVLDGLTKKNNESLDALQPIDNIVYKTFVKKFNEKYSDSLILEQRELLNKYITSFIDNGIELKIFMNEEVGRLKKAVSASLVNDSIKKDGEMIKKTKDVLSPLESFKERQIDNYVLIKMLKIQNLVREVQTDAD